MDRNLAKQASKSDGGTILAEILIGPLVFLSVRPAEEWFSRRFARTGYDKGMPGRFMLILLFVLVPEGETKADPLSVQQQRREISRASTLARLAAKSGRQGRLEAAAVEFEKAQVRLETVATMELDSRLQKPFARAAGLLREVHQQLSERGSALRPLELPEDLAQEEGQAPAGSPARRRSRPQKESKGPQVSFTKEVAPLLVAKCGRCHIESRKGGFSLATYDDLLRGSEESGRVVVGGNAASSVLIKLVAAGEMPRGTDRIAPQELQILVRWINQGIQNDATSPTATLVELASLTTRDAPPERRQVEPAEEATGNETVRFALDIAPVLAEACTGCHGNRRPRAELNLTTFQGLWGGGDSGPPIAPGDPEQSLLLMRLKGEGGDRMPLNRDALPAVAIGQIETWIREGARFDGASQADSLRRINSLARAEVSSPEELSTMRKGLAAQKWHLAIPDEKAQEVQTDRFLITGNLPLARLEELGQLAESQVHPVTKLFRHPEDEPWLKSRMTILAVAHRYDYSEFGIMVEQRELPAGWRGHWGYDGVDAYAVVYPAGQGEFDDRVLVGQQIAGVYVASQGGGRLPRWFVEGAARAAGAKLDSSDPRVKAWEKQIPLAIARLQQPGDFMEGKLSLELEGTLAYGFVRSLLKKPARVQKLLSEVGGGAEFDAAFQRIYRASSTELAGIWLDRMSR